MSNDIVNELSLIFGPDNVVVIEEDGARAPAPMLGARCHLAEAAKVDGTPPRCHMQHKWDGDQAYHVRYV